MSKITRNEQGMVSILVSMIMIIVISLIVIGFAQVSRRNQREALDNQLSTQAYYAAESGVNAAIQYFGNNTTATIDPQASTDCKYFINTYLGGGGYGTVNVLNSDTSTQYTCLMVNPAPGSLEATPVKQETNTVWHLANDSALAFKQLSFQWSQPATGAGNGSCPTITKFPAYNAWNCRFGILRVDLVNTASVNGNSLENGTGETTLYFVPSSASTSATPIALSSTSELSTVTSAGNCKSSDNSGCPAHIINAACAGLTTCKSTINLSNGSTDYYVRITMMYKDSSDLLLTGADTSGNASNFKGAQALIDSTGQSQDELRRVQVRVPLQAPTSAMPGYSLMSTDSVCKQINAGPNVDYLPGSCS